MNNEISVQVNATNFTRLGNVMKTKTKTRVRMGVTNSLLHSCNSRMNSAGNLSKKNWVSTTQSDQQVGLKQHSQRWDVGRFVHRKVRVEKAFRRCQEAIITGVEEGHVRLAGPPCSCRAVARMAEFGGQVEAKVRLG